MSLDQIERRAALSRWLNKRDTALMEAFCGLVALVVAWRVIDVFQDKPVAPLTSSALLQFSQGAWFFALATNGVMTLGLLVHGLATGNSYRLRGVAAFFASCIWTVVALAVITSGGPLSVAAGYVLMALFSWCSFVVLMVRADLKHKVEKAEVEQVRRINGGRECGFR